MNFIRFITVCVTVIVSASVHAQPSFIDPYRIEISSNNTTHIIFPFPIKSIDRGSLDVLAQKSPGADAVLQLKADHARIAPTNVTVITTDNKLYSFLVVYDSMPKRLTLSFDSASSPVSNHGEISENNAALLIHGESLDAGTLQATAIIVAGKKKKRFRLHASDEFMDARITDIYIKNDVYFFAFTINNKSNVSFSLETISFTLRDTKKVKRKASQEKAIQPLYLYQTEHAIKEHEQISWVIAVPKFTLEDNKHLFIQILEQNGGRNLAFEVRNKHLLAAKRL